MADEMIRATAAKGGIRAVGITGKGFVEEARYRHHLSAVSSAWSSHDCYPTALFQHEKPPL